jgi:tRNA U34 5-carboxymethylaminomethyl modifying enzyme MnmG/GidA
MKVWEAGVEVVVLGLDRSLPLPLQWKLLKMMKGMQQIERTRK